MENLITNFHNPEFLNILGMEIADGVVMCTAALCSFFIMICLQGEHNKITWKRIGLIYLWAFIAVAVFLCSGITEVFRGDVKSTIKSSVNWVGIFVYIYHPIVIALFYQKKRIRIGLKVFVLDYLLITAGTMMYLGGATIIRDAGKGIYMEEGADVLERVTQLLSDGLIDVYVMSEIVYITLILLIYFRLYRKGNYLKIRFIYLFLIGIWSWSISIFAGIFEVQTESEFLIGIRYCFIGLLVIVNMLLPVLFVLSSAGKQLKEKNIAQEIYLESELAYIEQYKKSQEQTRAFRHDIKNNLSLLQYMLKDGKMEEAIRYVDELSGKMKELSPQYITGDEMLDCIVAMKADKMSEMNIDFNLDGVIDGGLNMKPLGICTIFANILDNAIEAAGKVEDTDKRWISMTLKRSGQFWVINVGNSTDRQPDIDKIQVGGYTSKEDKGHHGFGLLNIRQTVEKQDGILKLETKEDAFSLTVMLPKVG